jgi:tetratricopeptide (TPR) repeat protein
MRAWIALALALPALADTGNAVCARCHAEIAKKYARTGMARTSGRTGEPGFAQQFGDPRVSAAFRMQTGGATRQLEWFLGSGHIGRSYLFRKGAQLFQAPLSYYSEPKKWDISPGYENKPFLELTRAVEPACLQCHASRLQPLTAPQPFLQAGVGCERCHGPGEKHAAAPSAKNIVNPAKLAAEERDSVCAQCHLTGAARIARAGRERGSFVAGQKLRDSIAIFVQDDAALSATSHFEKLAASKCRQASGERLWCGTCHDAHSDSTAAHYREQCQSCHASGACTAKAGDDCVGCHMPRNPTRALGHLAFTDHSIRRRPQAPSGAAAPVAAIREFWTGQADARDTALAHAVAGLDDAYSRLQETAPQHPKDVPLQIQFAQFHERFGQEEKAAALYAQILEVEPGNTTAAVNLGTFEIKQGRAKEAMALWLRALARNPALIGARLNLAVAQYQSGDAAAARASLKAVLDYEPEHPVARRMLEQLAP